MSLKEIMEGNYGAMDDLIQDARYDKFNKQPSRGSSLADSQPVYINNPLGEMDPEEVRGMQLLQAMQGQSVSPDSRFNAVGSYDNTPYQGQFNNMDTQGGLVDPNSQQPTPMFGYDKLIKDIPYYEGTRNHVYADPVKGKSVPTVGIGYNLNNPTAHDDLAQVGLTKDAVLGGQTLSPTQIQNLFHISLGRAEEDAKSVVPDFDNQPERIKKILVNMSFQLGRGKLDEFSPTIKQMTSGNYAAAADRLKNTPWYSQSTGRSKDIVNDLYAMSRDEPDA